MPVPTSPAEAAPVRVGLIGAGRIGVSHATLLARRVAGAQLVAVADPRPGVAADVAESLGARAEEDPAAIFAADDVEAVVITASSTAHAELVVAAAKAGKAVFCEKPMAMSAEDAARAVAAADEAGVPLQVGFNRRFDPGFAAAHDAIEAGQIGTVQLMRSLTRDPGLANPAGVPPWTIFTQTLIHDFDALLWLNPGANAVSVHATADALVAPEFKDAGLLDTAVVVVRFDNGAIATAEASFSAAYGYDVRGEVFGSAGMVTAGDGSTSTRHLFTAAGDAVETSRSDTDLFAVAYTGELAAFCDAVRGGTEPVVTGRDAQRALAIALACIESVEAGATVDVKPVGA
ncbi:Gfo/Idh/MocA family oxidoreductase [Solicola sp. PLA-1-18]|uniref:Gfo/Idh/MocA family oxidoreductase n=1 Tax=Solicola sp. PLA-1-18 TaxID=3380532 RepID=UPI003B7D7E49